MRAATKERSSSQMGSCGLFPAAVYNPLSRVGKMKQEEAACSARSGREWSARCLGRKRLVCFEIGGWGQVVLIWVVLHTLLFAARS